MGSGGSTANTGRTRVASAGPRGRSSCSVKNEPLSGMPTSAAQQSRNSTPDKPATPEAAARPARPKTAGIRDNVLQNQFKLARQKTFARDYVDDKTVVTEILKGNPNYDLKNDHKIVRIFTSSTFTDTKYERNSLMEKVYPKLKLFCQEHGYEFQIVDMRWGVREEAENDHMSTELCMKELMACKDLSTGPNFVTFLSHKYGYRPFPRRIDAGIFEQVTQNNKDPTLLARWFKKDENAMPPVYVLQPISTEFPDFLSPERQKMMKAKGEWWKVFEALQEILVTGAKRYLTDPDEVHDFLKSVTEREIELGILDENDPTKHCLWFRRTFKNIESVPASKTLSRYYECLGAEEVVDEVRDLLDKLATEKVPQVLPEDNVIDYDIEWTEKGVNPENEEHETYLEQLCQDFEMRIKDMISLGIKDKKADNSDDKLFMEVTQHAVLCKHKFQQFSGRVDILKDVKRYITTSKSNLPLIIHGQSGCGKTCLMSKVASDAWNWTNKSAAIIYRFIGTTGASSSICSLLTSINRQLCRVKNMDHHLSGNFCNASDYKSVVQGFEYLLTAQTKGHETDVILIIDSLDQLDNSDNGKNLEWIPTVLPPRVKIILSTLPEEKYSTFPRCQSLFPNPSCYIKVEELPSSEVDGILKKWLQMYERTLTPAQSSVVKEAYTRCPYPLFLKLSFDAALRWHSYDTVDVTKLQMGIMTSINVLFERLEKQHGQLMVVFSLSYLTLSKYGLTEGEMEDLLSLCDPVLNDVYQYWTPPLRRLPPLLWVRVRNELKEYLVTRGVDGVQVINWYHRQFTETATARYLADKEFVYRCHSDLSQYYLGIWAENDKPYVDKKGAAHAEFRYVSKQPLTFDNGSYNLRKLNQLPHHLLQAGEFNVLKDKVLCNYEFLLAKISATGMGSLLNLLKDSQMLSRRDEEVAIMIETLQLSQNAISRHSSELAGQVLGRVKMHETATQVVVTQATKMLAAKVFDEQTSQMMEQLVKMIGSMEVMKDDKYPRLVTLLEQCRESSLPVLVPHTSCLLPPGGQLLHKLGHLENVNDLDINANGSLLATGSDDNTVKFWKVETGEEMYSLEMESDVVFIKFSPDDQYLVASTVMGRMCLIDIKDRKVAAKTKKSSLTESCGPRQFYFMTPKNGENVLVTINGPHLEFFNVPGGNLISSLKTDLDPHENNSNKILDTFQALVACSSNTKGTVYLYSFTNGVETPQRREIRPFPDPISLNVPHVAAVAFANNGAMLVVQDGCGQGLLFYHTDSCVKTNSVKGVRQKRKSSLYFSVKNLFLYCSVDKEVEITNMANMEVNKYFPHPCKVLKVVSRDGRHVITMGEDSIIRVWDQTIRPMSADVSAYSGKVTAQSDQSMEMMQSVIKTFKDQFGEEALKTDDILTTKDVSNYWTKNNDTTAEGDIKSSYITIGDGRYLVVAHNTKSSNGSSTYTHSFTVWDLASMQCMRRTFLKPGRILLFGGSRNDEILMALIAPDRPAQTQVLYKVNLKEYETKELGDGYNPFFWNTLSVIPDKNVVIGQFGHSQHELHSFGITHGTLCCCYSVQCTVRPTSSRRKQDYKLFSSIQADVAVDRLIGLYDNCLLCIWKLSNSEKVCEVDLRSVKKVENAAVNYTITVDSKYVIAAIDDVDTAVVHGAEFHTYVIDLISGSVTFKGDMPGKKTFPVDQQFSQGILLRRGQPSFIQLVGLSSIGEVILVESCPLSKQTNMIRRSCGQKRCVTWCDDGTDQTVHLWQTDFHSVTLIGSFTLDDKVDDVVVVDNGNKVIVNTVTGLVSLSLQGKKVYKSPSVLENSNQIFNTQDLDAWISTP